MQESQHKSERISELHQGIEELRSSLLDCRQQIRENESYRRTLHNTIQELKGKYTCTCYVMCSMLVYRYMQMCALINSTVNSWV